MLLTGAEEWKYNKCKLKQTQKINKHQSTRFAYRYHKITKSISLTNDHWNMLRSCAANRFQPVVAWSGFYISTSSGREPKQNKFLQPRCPSSHQSNGVKAWRKTTALTPTREKPPTDLILSLSTTGLLAGGTLLRLCQLSNAHIWKYINMSHWSGWK